jgi:hypothetical protein
VATNSATTDHLVKFDNSPAPVPTDSVVVEVNGKVGIGTSDPKSNIHVFGVAAGDQFIGFGPDPSAGPAFNVGYSGASFGRSTGFFNIRQDAQATPPNPSLRFATADVQRMIITNTGAVGIGTLAPTTTLDVAGPIKGNRHLAFMPWANVANVPKVGYVRLMTPITDHESNMFSLHIFGYRYLSLPQAIDIRCSGYAYTVSGLINQACTASGTDLPVEVTTEPSGSTNNVVIRIGTLETSWYYPHLTVEYDGWIAHDPAAFVWSVETAVPAGAPALTNMNNVAIVNQGGGSVVIGQPASTGTRLTVNGNATFNGTLTATKVIGAVYQDVAEWVPATTKMTAGTVVVLNPDKSNEVMVSQHAYDTMVAGVVSAQPGILLGVAGEAKEQVATTGRVRVRVDARQSPVRIGDLLVTSDEPGAAMKSIPVEMSGIAMHRPGTIIGKALEPLAGGVGEILVLLSLQ